MNNWHDMYRAWKGKNRYSEVIRVCIPLVMSTAAITVMEFTDRIFLSNYNLDAISAATPAGVMALLFIAFFSGVCGYSSVFIAQYSGAGTYQRIGSALWQGIHFGILSWLALIGLSFMAVPIFRLGGHPPEIQHLEVIYFRILCLGGGIHVIETALSSFFTGRGITRPVMMINTAGMIINIPLDYALINGVWGAPELGITGAAIATVASWALILLLYAALIFSREFDRLFRVRQDIAVNREIFFRLMKYGIPGALQFSLDIFAFMFFIFMVGRIGKIELAVTNIVISINSLAFMPSIGFSQGVSTLVGQALGRKNPAQADHAVWSAAHILLIYIAILDIIYIFAPHSILSLFIPSDPASQAYGAISTMGSTLLRIVAAYVLLDALYMIFVGALRGAGDTRFIMWSIGIASLGVMVAPVFIGIEFFQMGVYYAWGCVTLFVASLFGLSFWRYRQAKWQHMLVIGQGAEKPPP